MANAYISGLEAADALSGDELVEISQLSSTVTITAATISAQASDNSYNDSGGGFVAAGFAVGNRVRVQGSTGDVANNILVGVITALTAGKMTIGGTDGDVIVDDAAGESVTISKWVSRRTTAAEVGALGGAGGGGSGAVGAIDIPAATAWRVRAPGSSRASSFGVGVAELKFLDATDANIVNSVSGTTLFSTTFATSNGFAPDEAYNGGTAAGDGWYASEFQSGSYNAYIGRQFASAVLPKKISLCPLNGYPNTLPYYIVVEFRDEAGIWQTVAQYDLAVGANNTFQTFALPTQYYPNAVVATKWSGKAIAIIGDSITEQSPGGVQWHSVMNTYVNSGSLTVDGFGGRTMASAAAVASGMNLGAKDALLICLGTNDYGNSGGRPVGSLGDTSGSGTFHGDIHDVISTALTANPSLRVAFLAPIQRTDTTAANSQGATLRDYVDALLLAGKAYSIPVFDLYAQGGISSFNSAALLSDGLHPNAAGQSFLGKSVAGFIFAL